MTDPTGEIARALSAAREAYAAATQALAHAEAAARSAGVDVSPGEVPELRVQRLRVVEADGTTRLIIGNSTMSELGPSRGEDLPHPGRTPFGGILFCNDDGTEAGGLVHAGTTVDGEAAQVGFLTFDDFEQNEGFRMGALQQGEQRAKWIEFADQPFFSLHDVAVATQGTTGAEREEIIKQFWPEYPVVDGSGVTRMRLSKETDGAVWLSLRDASGTERIRIGVEADGRAEISCCDLDGEPTTVFGSTTPS